MAPMKKGRYEIRGKLGEGGMGVVFRAWDPPPVGREVAFKTPRPARPLSCKGRALCPSCGGRRMAERAAHLLDHVFPDVPVRQWVLSLPYRMRYRWRGITTRAAPLSRCSFARCSASCVAARATAASRMVVGAQRP